MSKSKNLDLKGFKKVSEDDKSTTLKHPAGHTIIIAHKALDPKTRGKLAELKLALGGEVNRTEGNQHHSRLKEGPHATMRKEQMLANGGEVADKGPKVDPVKAKEMEDSAKSPGWDPAKWANNIKQAFQPAPDPSPTPTQHFDDGGTVQIDPNADSPAPPPVDQVPPQDPGQLQALLGQQPQQSNPDDDLIGGTEKIIGSGEPLDPSQAASTPPPPDPQNGGASASWDSQQSPDQNPAVQGIQAAALGAPAPGAVAQQALNVAQGQQQAAADPYGVGAQGEMFNKGIQEQKAGLYGQANAMGAQGAQEAKVLNDNIAKQQAAYGEYQKHYGELDQERQSLAHDVSNGHIDAHRFINNMSTGSKILTTIGLIFGGAQAQQLLTDNINRDVESQKAELGKKENLLSMNMKQFGNLKDATDMTRIYNADIISNQIKAAAAQNMSPVAKANALQAAGKLDQDSAQMAGQIAMRRSIMSAVNQGQAQPELVLRAYGAPDAAMKQLKEAQDTIRGKDMVLGAFDKLNEINTVGNRMMSPIQSSRQVAAIKEPLVASLSKGTAGRFTEQDAGMLEPLFPAPGDSQQTLAQKRAQINQIVSEKMNFPEIKQYGIDVNKLPSQYGRMGNNKIQELPPVKK